LLELIEGLADRLWLPHQVALEYHRHRVALIFNERKNCDDLIGGFRKLLTALDESRRHPFVSTDFRMKLDEVVTSLEAEVKATTEEFNGFKQKDSILERLTALYDGKGRR
jgi:hypothetical protein